MHWMCFINQAQKDARLWLLIVGVMSAARLGIVCAFHHHWTSTTGGGDVLVACLRGLRFDMQLATLWCLASFFVTTLCLNKDLSLIGDRVRRWLLAGFAAIAIPTIAIDIGYFQEYHDQFDHFLFGAIYDDRGAILETVWTTYHPLRFLSAALIGGWGVWWIGRRWIQRPWHAFTTAPTWPLLVRMLILIVCVGCLVVTARGSWQRRPLQIKDAAVVTDRLLNTWVPTPFHAFGHAWQSWRDMRSINGITTFIPSGQLGPAVAKVFPELGAVATVDDVLRRIAPGNAKPPRHIYLLIMESFDAWPLLERWKPLHLTDQVAELGSHGLLVTDFVPIGTGTMSTLSALLTGFPDVGVYTAYQPSVRQAFPTSPATIFKRLGYKTRFFYAGYLSWQRIGDFCHDQGFDELYGGGHIGNPSGNEWGVEDEALFDFALKTASNDAPTFNVILTTSNHPPYNVDVDAKGFPLKEIPAWTGFDPAGNFNRTILGHLWYSDRCAGSFIRAIDAKLPQTVVALTGDHWSRRTMTTKPTCYERSSVPLLLYGPSVLADVPRPPQLVGGQLDICPTLIELSAPAGFVYHAMGENILRPQRAWGLGANRVISPGTLSEFSGDSTNVFPTTGSTVGPIPKATDVRDWYNVMYGLGWWRLMRGNALSVPEH